MFLACGGSHQAQSGSTASSTSTGGTGGGGTGGGGTGGGTGGGAPLGPSDSDKISASSATVLEAEPHVAATSDGRVAVAWIGIEKTGSSFIGYAFSKDYGTTWTPPQKTMQPANLQSTDPVMAADAAGNIYLTWLAYLPGNPAPTSMRLNVAKAGPGATAFGPAVIAHAAGANSYDKPWITITKKGTIVVTHTESDSMTFSNATLVASKDGVTWNAPVTLPGASIRGLISVCASASTPRLYATYVIEGGASLIGLQWSDDEGVTWSKEVLVSGADMVGYDGPTCVADGNDVWVSYEIGSGTITASTYQQMTQVRVARSKDGGATFAAAVDAHDPALGKLFLHPTLALEGNGTLDVVYYSGAKPDDLGGRLLLGQSTDHGATFGPGTVEHMPVGLDLHRDNGGWVGDYLGVARQGGFLHIAYGDDAPPYAHIAYRRALAK